MDLFDTSDYLAELYFNCVQDIIDCEKVKKLDDWTQHNNTSRLQHSINVSYYSFLVCFKLGWDYKSAARAGLLHDLYFYDWRKKTFLRCNHVAWHPRIALDNARKICELNAIEEDCIKTHMWPCTLVPPRYKEGFVVTFTDKICATMEFFVNTSPKVVVSEL